MTKDQFQQELKEKLKEGIKPSQLKRSKSTENLKVPKAVPLQKSKSTGSLPLPPPSLSEQVKTLKQELSFSQNTAQNYLERLQKLEAEQDQLKQKANAKIEQANERANQWKEKFNQLTDQNNELRLKALKTDDQLKEYQKAIEQAATKFTNLQQSHTNFKVQNSQLLREKQDLETRLKTANERIQKLYQLKGLPSTTNPPYFSKSTLLAAGLLVLGLILLRP